MKDPIRDLAEFLIAKHGLIGWTFKYNTRKKALGLCRYSTKTIELQRYHAEQSDLKDIVDTLLHEIAHAMTPGRGHGPEWQAACQQIGAKPERLYHGPKIDVPAKWTLTCPTCGKQVKKHRKPTRNHSCGACDRKFNPDHIMTVRRNR